MRQALLLQRLGQQHLPWPFPNQRRQGGGGPHQHHHQQQQQQQQQEQQHGHHSRLPTLQHSAEDEFMARLLLPLDHHFGGGGIVHDNFDRNFLRRSTNRGNNTNADNAEDEEMNRRYILQIIDSVLNIVQEDVDNDEEFMPLQVGMNNANAERAVETGDGIIGRPGHNVEDINNVNVVEALYNSSNNTTTTTTNNDEDDNDMDLGNSDNDRNHNG